MVQWRATLICAWAARARLFNEKSTRVLVTRASSALSLNFFTTPNDKTTKPRKIVFFYFWKKKGRQVTVWIQSASSPRLVLLEVRPEWWMALNSPPGECFSDFLSPPKYELSIKGESGGRLMNTRGDQLIIAMQHRDRSGSAVAVTRARADCCRSSSRH